MALLMSLVKAFFMGQLGTRNRMEQDQRKPGGKEVHTTLTGKQRNGPVSGEECGDQGEIFFFNNGKYYSMFLSLCKRVGREGKCDDAGNGKIRMMSFSRCRGWERGPEQFIHANRREGGAYGRRRREAVSAVVGSCRSSLWILPFS